MDDTTDGPDRLGLDLTRPSISRLYDFVLGGKENFEVDRHAAAGLFRVLPEIPKLAHESRNMLRRAVRYLVDEAGIRQIVDLGSGLPTVGNIHEVAHRIDAGCRVVYVDIDPIVLAHGRALLCDDRTTTMIDADVRDVDAVFADPALLELIDLSQPFAVIMAGVLHHFSDADDPYATAAAVRERLVPGGYAVFTNFLDDDEPRAKELQRAFLEGGLGTGRFRTWAEQQRYFDGLEVVEPGLVYANDWHADADTPRNSSTHTLYAGGVGRKP